MILEDKRARIISPIYFSRLRNRLEEIPAENKKIILAAAGNYEPSRIFITENNSISKELKYEILRVAQTVPNFFLEDLTCVFIHKSC